MPEARAEGECEKLLRAAAEAALLIKASAPQGMLGEAWRIASEALLELSRSRSKPVAASMLKLAFEAAAQSLYLSSRHRGDEESYAAELRRRSRSGVSFTARMVVELPETPGPLKKRMMRAYLSVAEYVHPSARMYSEKTWSLDEEFCAKALKLLDYTLYLAMRVRVCLEGLAALAERYGLGTSLRYAGRVLRRSG